MRFWRENETRHVTLFYSTEKLEWLKMGHNHVNEIPTEALKGMHRLREFDFKANDISEIKEDAFDGFGRTLKFLYLQDNR